MACASHCVKGFTNPNEFNPPNITTHVIMVGGSIDPVYRRGNTGRDTKSPAQGHTVGD